MNMNFLFYAWGLYFFMFMGPVYGAAAKVGVGTLEVDEEHFYTNTVGFLRSDKKLNDFTRELRAEITDINTFIDINDAQKAELSSQARYDFHNWTRICIRLITSKRVYFSNADGTDQPYILLHTGKGDLFIKAVKNDHKMAAGRVAPFKYLGLQKWSDPVHTNFTVTFGPLHEYSDDDYRLVNSANIVRHIGKSDHGEAGVINNNRIRERIGGVFPGVTFNFEKIEEMDEFVRTTFHAYIGHMLDYIALHESLVISFLYFHPTECLWQETFVIPLYMYDHEKTSFFGTPQAFAIVRPNEEGRGICHTILTPEMALRSLQYDNTAYTKMRKVIATDVAAVSPTTGAEASSRGVGAGGKAALKFVPRQVKKGKGGSSGRVGKVAGVALPVGAGKGFRGAKKAEHVKKRRKDKESGAGGVAVAASIASTSLLGTEPGESLEKARGGDLYGGLLSTSTTEPAASTRQGGGVKRPRKSKEDDFQKESEGGAGAGAATT